MTLALTATVFSLWWSYHTWFGNARHPLKPLHISGVGYVREGRLVDKTPSFGSSPSRTRASMDYVGDLRGTADVHDQGDSHLEVGKGKAELGAVLL